MASIEFKMNNLQIKIAGVRGNMDSVTYKNLDPVDYIFKVQSTATGASVIYRFLSNTTVFTPLAGFHKGKTDESALFFLGATFPGA